MLIYGIQEEKDGETVTDSRDTENELVPLVINLLLGEKEESNILLTCLAWEAD